jgi:hypothetical protein
MVSASKGRDDAAADQGESFDKPQQALIWLRQCLSTATLPDSIEPPK